MNLLLVEMRRALHRRAIRALIATGLVGCVIAGAIALGTSFGKSVGELHRDAHPAVLTEWWIVGTGDGMLTLAFFFLLLGGLFGGATVAGMEWRSGTVATALTWEPRRLRLHTARTTSAATLAFVISFVLQVVFLASFVPAVLTNGSAAGADAGWWLSLLGAMGRASLLTAATATLAVALATLGRNTSFALVTVFAWMAVVETLLRELEPSLQPWLWSENLAVGYTWGQLDDAGFTRSPAVALTTMLVYIAAITVSGAVVFHRRDIASAS
jgi:ABC-2 type transport system permease protein